MKKSKKRYKISVALLFMLLMITAFVMLVCTILNYTFFNPTYYTENILTDEYYSSLKSQIDNLFQGQGVSRLFTTINQEQLDRLKDTVPYKGDAEGSVCLYSESLMNSIIEKMDTGSKFQPRMYSNQNLKKAVSEIVEEIAVEQNFERSDEDLANASETVYSEICSLISDKIIILPDSYWNYLPNLSVIYSALSYIIPMLFIMVALFISLLFVCKKKNGMADSFYIALIPLWIPSLFMLSGTIILREYNIPSKISESILTAISPLIKIFVTNLLNSFSEDMMTVSVPLCAVLTIGMIFSIILSKHKPGGGH